MRYLSTIALIFILSTTVSAQEAMQLSLQQAQDYATENNLGVKNTELDHDIMVKETRRIMTLGLPKLSSSVNYTNNFKLPVSIIPAGSFPGSTEDIETTFGLQHIMNIDFNYNQLLIDGRYFIGLKAIRTFLDFTTAQVELSEYDIRKQIANDYFACLTAEKGLAIIDSNLANLREIRYETNELYLAGFAEELDVDRLDLTITNLEATKEDNLLRYQLSLLVLKNNMSMPLDQVIELTDELDPLLLQASEELQVEFNPENRLEHKVLSLQLRIRELDAAQLRSGYYPRLDGFFGYNFNAQRNEFNLFSTGQPWFRSGYFGLQLTVPIFDSYERGFEYQQKRLEQYQIRNQLSQFELNAELQANNAKASFSNALNNLESQQKSMDLAQKIMDKVVTMRKEGLASSLELAEAESDLLEAQSRYITAMYDVLAAKNELEKALGQ